MLYVNFVYRLVIEFCFDAHIKNEEHYLFAILDLEQVKLDKNTVFRLYLKSININYSCLVVYLKLMSIKLLL